jgi:hypothetical protein
MVTDHDTNLQWTDLPNTQEEIDAYNEEDAAKQTGKVQKWINAEDYCSNLTHDGGGWRLPTIEELNSLVDTSHSDPAIDPIFSNTESSGYWSDTPCLDSDNYEQDTSECYDNQHRGIGFESGGWHHCSDDGREKFIRCVRAANGNSSPVITEGESVEVIMSEDSTPTPFDLTLNATDAENSPLTWSIKTVATHGSASVDDGTGDSEDIGYAPDAD